MFLQLGRSGQAEARRWPEGRRAELAISWMSGGDVPGYHFCVLVGWTGFNLDQVEVVGSEMPGPRPRK